VVKKAGRHLCYRHAFVMKKRADLRRAQAIDSAPQVTQQGSGGVLRTSPTTAIAYTTTDRGGRLGDPAVQIALKLRAALTTPQLPLCTVYDKDGVPIAEIDPITRIRTALK
jgi:hypothetical protein